jgi:hypothetical protein
MTRDIKEHLGHYIILSCLLMVSFTLFAYFRSNLLIQQYVLLGSGISYLSWGVIHHQLVGDLSKKIVLEYFLIAALVVLMLNAVLLQR